MMKSRMGQLIQKAFTRTERFVSDIPKSERKRYGQFFTSPETAEFMASLFDIPHNKPIISILDAGAGSGHLSIALVERLRKETPDSEVQLTCYETDDKILPILKSNLDSLGKDNFSYIIKEEHYILSQAHQYNATLAGLVNKVEYDLIIGNPPYMKISKDAPEAKAMPDVCHGAPNLYFLFASMGFFNLKQDCEMVYIIPRSWTSGAYFKAFRKKLLSNCILSHIHLFASRNKVFDCESVLQETMILKIRKTTHIPETVTITTSATNKDFAHLTTYRAKYNSIVSGSNNYVYLITNEQDENTVQTLSRWNKKLRDYGLQMKTGLTVDFREKEHLRQTAACNTAPLFYPHHIKNGKVIFPGGRDNEYITLQKKALTQKNTNYLFVKRFTAKEERRRLQCGVYLSRKYPDYHYISTQNKINFISGLQELSECVVYGLYVLFNSTLYDMYYRILNGSTQVNSTEINSMPIPDIHTIESMGKQLIHKKNMSEAACDSILAQYT